MRSNECYKMYPEIKEIMLNIYSEIIAWNIHARIPSLEGLRK